MSKGSVSFYDFDEYERLVAAAKAIDIRSHLLVLLSGEAGLRSGEMVACASFRLYRGGCDRNSNLINS